MSHWFTFCCHPTGCNIHIDDFNRANSTDIGDYWNECSGNWSISSQQLIESGTVGALLKSTKRSTTNNQIVFVDVIQERVGNKYRVYVNGANDCNSSYYVEWEVTQATAPDYVDVQGVLKICDSTGTVLEQDSPAPPTLAGNGRTLTVCVQPEGISASLSNSVVSWVWHRNTSLSASGYYVGLGNGSSNQIVFDNWLFKKHHIDDSECPLCICVCYDGTTRTSPPKKLLATFTATGGCSEMNGFTMALDWDRTTQDWIGSSSVACDLGQAPMDLLLACASAPAECTSWTLTQAGTCRDSDPDGGVKTCSSCTCNPFSLTFGPFYVYAGDLSCPCCGFAGGGPGTYTITITEHP